MKNINLLIISMSALELTTVCSAKITPKSPNVIVIYTDDRVWRHFLLWR